jgi:hypothetical protein
MHIAKGADYLNKPAMLFQGMLQILAKDLSK